MKKVSIRTLCFFIIFALVFSCASIVGAVENTAEEHLIYFDSAGWKNYNTIFCHIWKKDGNSFFSWQSKLEACNKERDGRFSYDLTRLKKSTIYPEGMEVGKDYFVIFSANTGVQAYDTTIGLECLGDTCRITGEKIENIVDPLKLAFETVWTKNSSSYGPHLAITSIGNIVGSKLCPSESKADIIADWLIENYQNTSVDVVSVLTKALSMLKVYEIENVISKLSSKTTQDYDLFREYLIKAKAQLYKGFKLSETSKAMYINDTFKIKAEKGSIPGKLSYFAMNKNIATVSKDGKVKAKKAGKTVIEVKLLSAARKFTVYVAKPKIAIVKKLTLPVTVNKKLTCIKTPSKGGKVTWSSSNKKVATISKKGKLKTISAGTATITAKLNYKGKTYKSKCKLKVKKPKTMKELIDLLYNS